MGKFNEQFLKCVCKSFITVNDKERFYIMDSDEIFVLLYEDNIEDVPLIVGMEYSLRIDTDDFVTKNDFTKVTFNFTFIDMFLNEYTNISENRKYRGCKVYVDYADSLSPSKPIKCLYLFPILDDIEED